MIRSTVSSISLAIIVISTFYSAASAQALPYVADTGVIDLVTGQGARVSAVNTGSEPITVRLKKTEYVENGIIDGVSIKQVSAQTTTSSIVLSGNECLVFYVGGTGASVRIQLYGSSQYLRPNAFLITSSGPNSGNAAPTEEISFVYQRIAW
jgi:hypothetical protein